MAGRKTKKVNPRRIPIPKDAADKDKIVDEATKDDMYHSWLLVANALVDRGTPPDDIHKLCDEVNQYAKYHIATKAEMQHAESLMGIGSVPRLNTSRIRSIVELEKFRRKVERLSMHTALSVICLGLENTGRFSETELHYIFLSAALTEAEISEGAETYEGLEELLVDQMVRIEIDEELI